MAEWALGPLDYGVISRDTEEVYREGMAGYEQKPWVGKSLGFRVPSVLAQRVSESCVSMV